MPTIDRAGVPIHYEVHGPANAPPILLSHGYGATSRMWDGQVAAFADRYRLVLWDMRGHGESGDPRDPALYSHPLTVGDMAAVLDACDIERAMIGGLSLGGVMSLAFHLAYPERVRALMLFDTGPGFRKPEARRQWNERAEARARELQEKGLPSSGGVGLQSRDLIRGAETPPGRDPGVGRHRSAQGLAGAARGMLAQPDGSLIGSLPQIAVPTLVLVGAEDRHFLAAADYMAAKIPGAQKIVIPGAGHSANLDQPASLQPRRRRFPRRPARVRKRPARFRWPEALCRASHPGLGDRSRRPGFSRAACIRRGRRHNGQRRQAPAHNVRHRRRAPISRRRSCWFS